MMKKKSFFFVKKKLYFYFFIFNLICLLKNIYYCKILHFYFEYVNPPRVIM